MRPIKLFAAALILMVSTPVFSETLMYMAEEDGCFWCARWNKEIGPIYPKTDEGKTAPLRRFDLHEGPVEDIEFRVGVNFTPTFILVDDGKEVGRIEGYPGEDFFWGLLTMMFERAEIKLVE